MADYQFQTEVNQLLKLIIHSMYSNRDIFLREIISNASDALDKLKYLTVSEQKYKDLKFDPRIDISFDENKKTLTVQDTGLGMNDKDLSDNLGTIARSGTKAFMEQLKGDAQKQSDLIGQFGVGFYSAFMVAKKIDVYTKKAAEKQIFHWSSDGTNSYSIEEIKGGSTEAKTYGLDKEDTCGTAVVMSLNDDSSEYATRWRLDELVKKYSDHIAFAIYLHYDQNEYDDKGKVKSTTAKTQQINSASALWKRSKSDLKKEDYNNFYKALSHDNTDPLMYVHTHAEGTQEYTTLFYVPQKAPFDMYQADYKSGVKLYVKRVFITDDDRELLPSYLRFVRGVIDSEDLPLNVSREILQQNRILESIKTGSVKKLLSEFEKMAKEAQIAQKADNPTQEQKDAIKKWQDFVGQYNRPLKEGLYSDYANRDELAKIIRFKTSAFDMASENTQDNKEGDKKEGEQTDNTKYTSLADYVSRMKEGQKAIYYITGSKEKNLRDSPLLEAYKKKGFEVLICDDEIDDIVIPAYGKYQEYDLKAVNRADSDEELGVDKEEAKKKEETFKDVVKTIKDTLGDKVKDVRLSKRLSSSASCIVVDENDPSEQMQRMLKAMGQAAPDIKPILEVNADHALVASLKTATDKEYIQDVCCVLLQEALLVNGTEIKDPADFVAKVNRLLCK